MEGLFYAMRGEWRGGEVGNGVGGVDRAARSFSPQAAVYSTICSGARGTTPSATGMPWPALMSISTPLHTSLLVLSSHPLPPSQAAHSFSPQAAVYSTICSGVRGTTPSATGMPWLGPTNTSSPNSSSTEGCRGRMFTCGVHASEGLFTCAAMVGPDEYFISKFFLDRGVPWSLMHMRFIWLDGVPWTRVHMRWVAFLGRLGARFGAISWVVDEALKGQVPPVFGAISWVVDEALQGQAPPVFIHYVSEKPWVAPAGPSTAPAGPTSTVKTSTPAVTSTVTNWSDFLVWDSIAEQVVGLLHAAGEEEAGAASRLFAGWDARRKLPVVFPEKQG
ncbi:unnamed protein product [Closterium sp. NIES-65]|nr:unnamed protein product [Closterium sp. NIES-65]